MKKFKIALIALLIVGVGALVAFSTNKETVKEKSKVVFAPTECFKYIGPRPATATSVAIPSNWQRIANCVLPCETPLQVVCAIKVDANHVYTSGAFNGLPKVDQDQQTGGDSNDKLKTDLQSVTPSASANIIKTWYEIYLTKVVF